MYISTLYDYKKPTWIQAVIVEQVFLKKNLNINIQGETPILKNIKKVCSNATM